MRVGVTNLIKTYNSPEGPVAALTGIDFEIAAGEFYTLLGPSGCGKSTTLRCIAGLEYPNDGEITIGEEIVSSGGRSTPANLRPIGMVFQSYAIWPGQGHPARSSVLDAATPGRAERRAVLLR